MIKELAIKLGLWQDGTIVKSATVVSANQVMVDAGWYQQAMKHYCGTCEIWFKTASVAVHNRFKHKDAQ